MPFGNIRIYEIKTESLYKTNKDSTFVNMRETVRFLSVVCERELRKSSR